ncbi:hypothetical protein [Bacillus horti]|uniref:DnaJ-class molecular chaperone n=1 Tax=Caldalkalibacillus horti TaxID=77523 RepID=A0ABT9VTJ3_9BACI|nr:hypothetical protein [Bacillus horti]MDQ0164210.1 DnaJ-class molecular chaperone [Bacillus horti]
MVECKKCEGLGVIECPDCAEGSYSFYMNETCATCQSQLIMRCTECVGKGRVPKDKK